MKLENFFDKFEIFAEAPSAVPKMRELVLALAVRGKLVPHDPNDGLVKDSLPELAAVAVKAQDDLYPSHWLRVHLREVGEWRGGGTPSKARMDYWEGEIPWVSPKDMKAHLISDAQNHISEAAVEASPIRLIPKGSILMVVRGMALARSLPVALTAREVAIHQDIKALIPREREAAEFLLLTLRALEPAILASIDRSTNGIYTLRTAVLESLLVPLPPLSEQRRIVAKVNTLLGLLNTLEVQLTTARSTAERLLNALVAELSAGA